MRGKKGEVHTNSMHHITAQEGQAVDDGGER